MKRIVSSVLALAALAALVVVTTTSRRDVQPVYAQSGCTDATLIGNYAVIQPAGFTTPKKATTGNEVPWQIVGVITFDGAGNASASYSGSLNGSVFTGQTTSGTYIVNSDCSASLSFTSGDAAGYTANMVIIGGGAEVFGTSTNTGNTASFDAKRQ
jgi:hypothetical protein